MFTTALLTKIHFLFVNKPLPGFLVPTPMATDPRDVRMLATRKQENAINVWDVILFWLDFGVWYYFKQYSLPLLFLVRKLDLNWLVPRNTTGYRVPEWLQSRDFWQTCSLRSQGSHANRISARFLSTVHLAHCGSVISHLFTKFLPFSGIGF